MKFDFQTDEGAANERLKEELGFALINDLKMARQAEGVLTLHDIALAIQQGVGDDFPTLASLMYIMTEKKKFDEVFVQVKNSTLARNGAIKKIASIASKI